MAYGSLSFMFHNNMYIVGKLLCDFLKFIIDFIKANFFLRIIFPDVSFLVIDKKLVRFFFPNMNKIDCQEIFRDMRS